MRPGPFFFFFFLIRTPGEYRHYGMSPGGGEGTAIYGLYSYVPLWRVCFSSSLLGDRVYKLESLGLE